MAETENFRKATADMIEANNKKITVLEQKNSDLKKKLDDYKVEDKEQWEKFKVEFSKDMNDLGTAFGNFLNKK